MTDPAVTEAADTLSPINGEEMSTDELIGYVHEEWCGAGPVHHAQCNTLRLLVDDWRYLTEQHSKLSQIRRVLA